MRTTRTLFVSLLALGLPLAACGGDDSSSEPANGAGSTATTAAAATGSTGTTGAAATGSTGGTTSTTVRAVTTTAATGATTTAAAAKRADCLAVADLYNRILLGAGLGGGAIPAAKLDALKKTVSDVTAAAPADLKSDFATVGEAYIASGTNGDTSKLTSNAYSLANGKLAKIITTC
jgi:hypothetical protein